MRLYEQAIQSAREHGFVQKRGAWPMSWPRRFFTGARLRYDRAPRLSAGGAALLSSLGARAGKGAATRTASSASPRRTGPCISHRYHWARPSSKLDCRDGAQGPQQAVSGEIVLGELIETAAGGFGGRGIGRRRAWPAPPVFRATSHGSWRKRRRAADQVEVTLRPDGPCSPAELPVSCSIT